MREILFRGKRTDGKGWIEGYYFEKPNPYSEDGVPVIHAISDLPPFGSEVDHDTVGQYTGHKDARGVRIFEDDIIRHVDAFEMVSLGVVRFGTYCNPWESEKTNVGFYIEWLWLNDCALRCDFAFWTEKREINVIGNIFDNPGLVGIVKTSEEGFSGELGEEFKGQLLDAARKVLGDIIAEYMTKNPCHLKPGDVVIENEAVRVVIKEILSPGEMVVDVFWLSLDETLRFKINFLNQIARIVKQKEVEK